MAKKEDDGEQSRVRWLIDGARYAVAALVIALTILVIARAIVVSTRSEKLNIYVANCYLAEKPINSTWPSPPPPKAVTIVFMLMSFNPSGRVGMQYTGVNVTFLYSNNSEITWFEIPHSGQIEVAPETVRQSSATVTLDVPSDVPLDFVQKIYKDGEMKDTTVRLSGMLRTQISGLKFTRGHFTRYDCSPVTIGNRMQPIGSENVTCQAL